jgi:hypothetical protein
MFGKRLINTGVALCPSSEFDIFGDSSGVALYQLNSNADDSSGNYNGTATDVTYVSGYINNAGSFNGTSSRIVVPNRPLYTMGTGTPFGLSAWVKLNNLSLSGCIYTELGGNNTQYALVYDSSGFFKLDGFNGSQNVGARTTSTIQADVWCHIVGTVSGGTCKIYLNGVEEGQFASSIVNRSTFTNFDAEIGAFANGAALKLNGQIDQFRIFNKTLSASEVTTLYNEVAC